MKRNGIRSIQDQNAADTNTLISFKSFVWFSSRLLLWYVIACGIYTSISDWSWRYSWSWRCTSNTQTSYLIRYDVMWSYYIVYIVYTIYHIPYTVQLPNSTSTSIHVLCVCGVSLSHVISEEDFWTSTWKYWTVGIFLFSVFRWNVLQGNIFRRY